MTDRYKQLVKEMIEAIKAAKLILWEPSDQKEAMPDFYGVKE